MAIPVARVHLAMAHAALPGLLPTPPTCTMLPLLPAPPCAILLPNSNSPPRPSRADAAGRWDAHKIKPAGGPASSSSSSSSGGRHSLDMNRKVVALNRTSSGKNSNSRADSEERWDAHKRPATARPASSSSSSSSTASSNKTKTCHVSRCPNSGARASSSSSERWDAHKKPRAPPADDELDDGESSTASNDVELDMPRPPPLPPRSFYAGPGFITSPEPCMLPMPSFCRIRVA